MKKRYIVMPRSVDIANKLYQILADPQELIEALLTEYDFNRLDKSVFFYFLNTLVNVNIDDYEGEIIEGMG